MFLMNEDAEYTAGQTVPPGRYVRVDEGGGRVIELAATDLLPASCDGRVAVYRRCPAWPWLTNQGIPFRVGQARVGQARVGQVAC